jgi:hypothetical protein
MMTKTDMAKAKRAVIRRLNTEAAKVLALEVNAAHQSEANNHAATEVMIERLPEILSADDRNTLIEEAASITLDAANSELEFVDLVNGIRGFVDYSDEELLANAVEMEIVDGAVDFDQLDPVNSRAHHIWMKYKAPNLLCSKCGGTGTNCPACDGDGLYHEQPPLSFVVFRTRTVTEFVNITAPTAKAAAIAAKFSSRWSEQVSETLSLDVFMPKDANQPLTPGSPAPLYHE